MDRGFRSCSVGCTSCLVAAVSSQAVRRVLTGKQFVHP